MGMLSLASCAAFDRTSSEDATSSATTGSSSSQTSTSSKSDSSSSSDPQTQDSYLTIYSINDFHGKIKSTTNYKGFVTNQGSILNDQYYDEDNSVILSAGDMWQGTYASGYDKGISVTRLMNSFSFSAMALGNHEFDWGFDNILDNAKEANFPFLCANLIEKSTNKRPEGIDDHVVLNINGYKLGVVGLIGDTQESSIKEEFIQGYEFMSDMSYVTNAIENCNKEGSDANVILLHNGKNEDYTTKIRQAGLDAVGVFGGHTHSFDLENDSTKLPYVQGGSDSKGYSYMRINKATNSLDKIGYLESSPSDASYATESFATEVSNLLSQRTAPAIAQIKGYWTKAKTTNFVLKAMFEMTKIYRPDANYDESTLVACHNNSGIRGIFEYSSTVRDFTMEDIQAVSPFSNAVMLLPNRQVNAYQLETVSTGSSRAYCTTYPDSSSWGTSTSTLRTMDIVTIDYLVSDQYRTCLSPTGAEDVKGKGKEPIYIYDMIAEYAERLNAEGTIIDSSEY